jgi:hypothetical protein
MADMIWLTNLRIAEQLESIGDAGGEADETKEMLRTLIDVLQS